MDAAEAAKIVWATLILIFVVVLFLKARRKGRHPMPGPGAYGSIYDLLNQDKRNAIELIVEEKAEARDPEDADGNLPDLEDPRRATHTDTRLATHAVSSQESRRSGGNKQKD
jgi:hypothetical protein